MKPHTIALVTYTGQPDLTESDRLLIEPLARYGLSARAVSWDSPNIDWHGFDSALLRSCWDYHRRPAEFLGWLERLAAHGVVLWNPPDVVRWNMNKRYLRELAAAGLPVVPTVWPAPCDTATLEVLMARQGWERAVVKPQIGSNADQIVVVDRPDARTAEQHFQALRGSSGALVQRFMPEIAQGEWSLVFICEQFSHAVLKRPQPGSVFVQSSLGGSWSIQPAPQRLVEQATRVLGQIPRSVPCRPLLYARVDGLEVDGVFVLMELELIEPRLFFTPEHPQALERFADAVAEYCLKRHEKQ